MTERPDLISLPTVVDLLKERCNRQVSGTCHRPLCLRRGGHVPGDPSTYDQSTCEYDQAVKALEAKDELLALLERARLSLRDDREGERLRDEILAAQGKWS